MITDPLTHWTHFWYEKAVAYLPANPMTQIQGAIFWNLVQRIFYNPIRLASELSISQLNAFIAAAVEKLTFDSLTEMTNNAVLSNEARRFQIIKSILQEYSDVIIGPDQWLSKKVLGTEFYNHLADPKKVKDMNNRQKQFKQYKKTGPLDLLALVRNFRTHYDQQPPYLRKTIFYHENLDHMAAVQDYYAFFDKKFPGFFSFVYEAASFAKSSALGEFYIAPFEDDILDFNICYRSFNLLFKKYFNHDLNYERFSRLFELKMTKYDRSEISVTQSWIKRTEDEFAEKEKLPKVKPARKMSESSKERCSPPIRKQRKHSPNSSF
ncbi:unnamed protein product [Oikopleura dioica]|uniref:KEN domain-containing protein n=1 Tax=Oikopleura dioica TaxID=34765 RepID=E4X2W3_OIKDI|nr:unnamed protein product [Oikopleura dioica]